MDGSTVASGNFGMIEGESSSGSKLTPHLRKLEEKPNPNRDSAII